MDTIGRARFEIACIRDRNPCGGWVERAACLGAGPRRFHPGKGDTEGVEFARRICAACRVRYECLEHALANNERYGIFGGLTKRERRMLARLRRRGS